MFKSLFKKKQETEIKEVDKKITAITSLLVEAALIDEDFGTSEKEVIISVIRKQFKINDENQIKKMIDEAVTEIKESGDLVSHTRVIKENWPLKERISVIEMLWKVCLVDGVIEPYEDMLIRRIAGLIYVSDKERNLAKKKVMDFN